MRPYDLRVPVNSGQGALKHFVGNSMCEHDKEIRRSYPAAHIRAGLAEYLGLASVFPTCICILSLHTLIPAENYYAHKLPPALG